MHVLRSVTQQNLAHNDLFTRLNALYLKHLFAAFTQLVILILQV